MRKIFEFFGAVLVIVSIGIPGAALCLGVYSLIMRLPQPWQGMLLFVALLASPFVMVASCVKTFTVIERFLRWAKLA